MPPKCQIVELLGRSLKATILSEYASKMQRCRAFWKLDAIRLPNYASEMSDRGTLGKRKAMLLSEYTAFWKLDVA